MTRKHPTKAAWADAQADDYFERARTLKQQASGGYAQAARKADQVRHLEREAGRYRTMAVRYRARGL